MNGGGGSGTAVPSQRVASLVCEEDRGQVVRDDNRVGGVPDVSLACEDDNRVRGVADVSLACEDNSRVRGVPDVSLAHEDDNRVGGVTDVTLACEDDNSTVHTGNLLFTILSCITFQYFLEGQVLKAAIAFISDDRGHGWEQIEDFNKRTFEILSEFGLEIKNWTRMSDGCASQYKSKYSILKLTEAREMMEKVTKNPAGTVRFELFGSYEGKNESDALGSLVKNILDRAINKDRDGAISINNAEDAVEVINREKPEASTNKYCLWRVEKVPPTVRNPKPNGIPIKGIRKLHSFLSKPNSTTTK